MDRESQLGEELEALRSLCDAASPRTARRERLQALSPQSFREPEHQVVFESVRVLLSRGDFSPAQLRIHLNNRGFPDTDVDKYFQREQVESADPQ